MRSRIRGDTAEAFILTELVEAGCTVLLPFSSDLAYDLAVDTRDGRLIRVQCKTAWRSGGCLEFNTASTDHGAGHIPYEGKADVLAVADLDARQAYLVRVCEAPLRGMRLRLTPTLNNQRVGIRMAADYTFERRLGEVLAG